MSKDGTNNARELEKLAIQRIMSSEDGRNFMKRILDFSGVDDDTFDSDPITHANNAGKRSVGLMVRDELMQASPHAYLNMMTEEHD